jgi:RsiW-degrading membrane proteinase PrsW (M82 family)
VHTASDRARSLVPLVLGIVTLAAVVLLFAEDAVPRLLPAGSHEVLAAFSLAMIACAYVVFQLAHRRPVAELVKTILLAAAFLFWAANQLWPSLPQASRFNDIAIGLFVLDVFFAIAGWPAGSSDSFLGDCCARRGERSSCGCACCCGALRDENEVLERMRQ